MSRYQYNEAATVPAINAELEKIQEAIEDSLSRSGDTPNTMTAPLDMNGERIMNLPEAVSDSEPMRKGEAQPFVDAAAASATAALQSEQAAAASASSASASASSSSADAAVAEQLVEELNSLYLGAFNSNPATDNEGNALVKGVLYYNNVLNEIYVFNGISWVIAASQQTATDAASSAFQAASSAAAALASQNAASTSASQASASASSASTSSTQASGFAASASDSATAAQTSATNASGSATDAAASAAAALSSENVVSDSADAAALSETNAAGSATAAASSATSASNSASAAATSASNAAGSATAAATSETNAASSASSASASATSASNSAATALLYLNDTEAARDEVLQYSTAVSKGLVFIGLYDASTGVYPTLPVDIVGNPFWIISTGGTVSGTVLNPGDSLIYDVTNEVFIKLDTVDQVVSVAGKTGAVSLDKSDVGLANVDNTSDLNKPISTATQTALDLKVDDSQLATAATANSVAQRTSDGSINAVDVNATRLLTTGKVGIGTSSPASNANMTLLGNTTDGTITQLDQPGVANWRVGLVPNTDAYAIYGFGAGSYPERLRIDSSGNVGIGMTPPVYGGYRTFTLKGDNAVQVEFYNNSRGLGYLELADTVYKFDASNSQPFVFNTGGAERLRIDSSGNVGIGLPNPATFAGKLAVNGQIAITSGHAQIFWNATNNGLAGIKGVGTNELAFVRGEAGTESMRIDSSGNVGIGTSSPLSSAGGGLTIGSTSAGKNLSIFSSNNGNNGLLRLFSSAGVEEGQIYSGADTTTFYSKTTLRFTNDGGERMRIDSSGNVLVGATSPLIGFSKSITVSNGTDAVEFNADRTFFNASNYFILNTSSIGVKLQNGATAWAAQSDETTKDIIEPITEAVSKVCSLRSVIGKYKKDEVGVRRSFLIAQDVQAVLPEAVSVDADNGTLDLRYTETIPLLVAAIKEQQEIIKAQGESIAALEARIEALEGDTNGSL